MNLNEFSDPTVFAQKVEEDLFRGRGRALLVVSDSNETYYIDTAESLKHGI